MNASPIEQLNIAPELADRLRPRRPGYDRIAEIVADYSEVALSKKGSTLEAEDIAVMFVQPALEALGWNVTHVEESPFQDFQDVIWPLVAEYRGLQMVIGVRDLRGSLLNYEGDDGFAELELSTWAKNNGVDYGLLTNFTTNRIWRFSNDPSLSTLSQPLLEVDIRDYLTNVSSELDILAAERFYKAANMDLPQQTNVTQQTNIPHETLKVDEVDLESDEPEKPLPNLGPYGEPDGSHRRADEIMPGLSFGSNVAPRRTITALVTDRESGQPRLLLAGGTLPENTSVIQPGEKNGGTDQDKFGVVEWEVFSTTALAAIAKLDGSRPFRSTLPTGFPIARITKVSPGMQVCKFGGGTGYSQGTITLTHAAIEIKEDFERTITLQDAFMVGDQFTGPGDVGAPVITLDSNQIVGVVVGYTEKDTVCLPIQPILDQLNVDLITEPKRFTVRNRPSEELAALSDSSHGQDRLGFDEYANAFVRLIQDTVPPLTIGIYGAWGSGKSFLMNMILEKLESPGASVLEVQFKAWDYNGTDKLWAGLVEQIFGTMEQEMGWFWQFWFNFRRNLQREWRQIKSKLLPYTLIAIGIMIAVVWLLFDEDIQNAIAKGGIITFLLLLIPQLIKLFSTSASQRVVDMFAAQDYKNDIGFMGRIKSDLKDFADNLPTNTKVIVFIDDLDRCDPRKAVEVLEAIKLLLELKQFIVFLALDARIITQAVEEHYGKILVDAEITGYEYLDKIVQIPFSIPEPPPKELRGYLGSLVNLEPVPPLPISTPPDPTTEIVEETLPLQPPAIAGDAPLQPAPTPTTPPKPTPIQTEPPAQHVDQPPPTLLDEEIVAGEVPFTPAEQQALLDYYAFLDPNPRRLKRLVNVYRLVRTLIMGQQEQTDLLNNPDNTIGWLVLCEQWPYAAHMMLEILDENLTRTADDYPARKSLMEASLVQLNQAAQTRITHNADESLRKLDLNYGRLSSFVETHLADVTMRDIKTLRPFTVNFNPALSAEVRLTLAHH